MIAKFVEAWNKNKDALMTYFKTHEQGEYCNSYGNLVKLLFDVVINPEFESGDIYWSTGYGKFNTDSIVEIDDGDWQGSIIFVLHRNVYQPSVSDYVYTNAEYGSCSYCDTLKGIHGYDYGLPREEQVNDYMELCLHLLQRCKFMGDENDE